MAVGHNYLHKEIADVTTTHLTFADGQAAHIHVSWLHPFKEQRLVVIGERGMAVFDDGKDWQEKLVVYPHTMEWRNGKPLPQERAREQITLQPAEPLRLECEHFLACVSTGERARTDGKEALGVLRVLDAAQRSIDQGRMVGLSGPAFDIPSDVSVHETAVIDNPVVIGSFTRIWHFSHVLPNSRIGKNCSIGQNVVIGPDVTVGNNCKIQNNVSVYPGVTLEDGVFCGPGVVFTNVTNPRAFVSRKHEFKPTLARHGATIGANATVVCGHTIGRYAFIAAGAVVTHDVPDYALVLGNPARVVGFVCACGERLPANQHSAAVTCRACGTQYLIESESCRVSEKADV